jgi:hypothetical protein
MFKTDLLAKFIEDQKGWIETSDYKSLVTNNEDAKFSTLIQGDLRITNSGIFFGKQTSVETPKDGKKPKPSDMKELLTNNRLMVDSEEEIYNDDEIPFCTYQSMSYDPKLSLAARLISGFISRLSYSIDTKDPKIKAVVETGLKPIYSKLVRDMVGEGLKNGFMFGEKVWERRQIKVYDKSVPGKKVIFSGSAILPRKIKTLDPNQGAWSFFINTNTDELVRVEQEQSAKTVSVKRNKLVWFALDQEYSYIFGRSRFKNSYQAWYYSGAVKAALLQKLDKTGDPPAILEYPEGYTRVGAQNMPNDAVAAGILSAALKKKGLVIPSTKDDKGNSLWKLSFLEIKNDMPDAYLKVLELLDKEKVEGIGIFGNIIAGQGNFSEIDAKEDLTLVMIEDVVDQIEKCIQCELVDWIVSYNFGPDEISDVKFEIDRNSLGRSKTLKEILKELMRVLSSDKENTPKMMPDIKQICDQLGIPISAYGDLVIPKPIPEVPQGNPAVPGAKPGAGKPKATNLVKAKQHDEDTSERNRATKDERERERPSKEGLLEK